MKDTLKQVLEFLFLTSYRRALSSLIVLGTALVGLSWADVVLHLLVAYVPQRTGAEEYVTWAQIVGVVMICVGFSGHLILHIRSRIQEERLVAATLVGRLRVLVNGFRDTSVSRDAGYFNNAIAECQDSAKRYLQVAPKNFVGDGVIAAVANPKFDASKKKPYFNLELTDLEALVERLRTHYEIE